eukprot:Tbor_TRINITY_DN3134_c0_g1::TRINITY_DN3134_c0_g1_i1::g.14758::m.14758
MSQSLSSSPCTDTATKDNLNQRNNSAVVSTKCTKSNDNPPPHIATLQTFVAGGLAGAISRTTTAPLDRVKVLVQEGRDLHKMIQPKKPNPLEEAMSYRRLPRCESPTICEVLRHIHREDGVRGFWRGNGVNCLKAGPEFALIFTVRRLLAQKVEERRDWEEAVRFVKEYVAVVDGFKDDGGCIHDADSAVDNSSSVLPNEVQTLKAAAELTEFPEGNRFLEVSSMTTSSVKSSEINPDLRNTNKDSSSSFTLEQDRHFRCFLAAATGVNTSNTNSIKDSSNYSTTGSLPMESSTDKEVLLPHLLVSKFSRCWPTQPLPIFSTKFIPEVIGNFIIGAVAGATAQIIMYPLELIKTRISVSQKGEFSSASFSISGGAYQRRRGGKMAACISDAYRRGGIKEFYRGLTPNLVGVVPYRGLEVGLFFTVQKKIQKRKRKEAVVRWREYRVEKFLFKEEKKRIKLNESNSLQFSRSESDKRDQTMETSYFPTFFSRFLRSTVDSENLGCDSEIGGINLLKEPIKPLGIPFVYDPNFNPEKVAAERTAGRNSSTCPLPPPTDEELSHYHLSMHETAVIGSLASTVAQTATYPLNVVRTRLQTQGVGNRPMLYSGMIDCFAHIVKKDGARGLFRGLTANYLKAIPASCVAFMTFDEVGKAFEVYNRRRYGDGSGRFDDD